MEESGVLLARVGLYGGRGLSAWNRSESGSHERSWFQCLSRQRRNGFHYLTTIKKENVKVGSAIWSMSDRMPYVEGVGGCCFSVAVKNVGEHPKGHGLGWESRLILADLAETFVHAKGQGLGRRGGPALSSESSTGFGRRSRRCSPPEERATESIL